MNYKGGVGKTTLTSNISAELAYRGYKVLMIDLDPQSSLTFSFVTPDDWKSHLSENKTIKNWFTFEDDKVESFRSLIIAPKHANQAVRENQGGILNLVASHLDLINIDLELAAELKGSTPKQQQKSYLKVHNILREGLYSLNGIYDYVMIDTDQEEMIDEYDFKSANALFFVSSYDKLYIKKGLELLKFLCATKRRVEPNGTVRINKITFFSDVDTADARYFEQLSENLPVEWTDKQLNFPYDQGDISVSIRNQYSNKFDIRMLSKTYKDALANTVEVITGEPMSEVKKVMKNVEKNSKFSI